MVVHKRSSLARVILQACLLATLFVDQLRLCGIRINVIEVRNIRKGKKLVPRYGLARNGSHWLASKINPPTVSLPEVGDAGVGFKWAGASPAQANTVLLIDVLG